MTCTDAQWTPEEEYQFIQHILDWIGNDAIAAAIRDSLGIYQDIDHTIDLLSSNEDLINALKNQKGSFNIKNKEEFEIIKNRMLAIPAFIRSIDEQRLYSIGRGTLSLSYLRQDFDALVRYIPSEDYSLIPEPSCEIIRCATFRSKDALWDTVCDDVCRQQCVDINHSDGLIPSVIESDGEHSNNGQICIDTVDGEKDLVLDNGIHTDEDTSTVGGGDVDDSAVNTMISNNIGTNDGLGCGYLHSSNITDGRYVTNTSTNIHGMDIIDDSVPIRDTSVVDSGSDGTFVIRDSNVSVDTTPVIDDELVCTVGQMPGNNVVDDLTHRDISGDIISRVVDSTSTHTTDSGVKTTLVKDIMNGTGDVDLVYLYKTSRGIQKKIRRALSKHLTGTSGDYQGASSIAEPFAIIIQKCVRRFLASSRSDIVKLKDHRYHRRVIFSRQPVCTPRSAEKDWDPPIVVIILMHGCMSPTIPHHIIHDWQWIDLLVRGFGDKTGDAIVVRLTWRHGSVCSENYTSDQRDRIGNVHRTIVYVSVRIHDQAMDWDIVVGVSDLSGVGICLPCGQHYAVHSVLCSSLPPPP